jgi:hypothetical protein
VGVVSYTVSVEPFGADFTGYPGVGLPPFTAILFDTSSVPFNNPHFLKVPTLANVERWGCVPTQSIGTREKCWVSFVNSTYWEYWVNSVSGSNHQS